MIETLRMHLLCLRYARSVWVEPNPVPTSSRWRWVIRDRLGRDVLHSNGTWKDRWEVVRAVEWMKAQIGNVQVASTYDYPHDEDLRDAGLA